MSVRPAIVVVVDDSIVARALLESRLIRRGVAFRSAGAVAEAAALDLEGVGAALLDLELGDGSGVDVAIALDRRPLRCRSRS